MPGEDLATSDTAIPTMTPEDTETARILRQLTGHVGNLTPQQEEVFKAFKENLTTASLYTPSTEDSGASHDDATLLRFLRARSWSPPEAQKQFSDCEEWRKKHNVEVVYKEMTAEALEDSRHFYPRWTGRRDKAGIPLYVYQLASLDSYQHLLDKITVEERFNRIVALNEYMTRFTFPMCTHLPRPVPHIPISSTTTIIDLNQVSFMSMWKLRHLLGEASRLTTANYPETLHMVAIVNSPSFFPTIWGWIKGWFDEGTRTKIHVLGKDPGPALLDLVHAHDLPLTYGGQLEWTYDSPSLDEHAMEAIGEMPKGPVIFIDGKVVDLHAA